MQTFKTSPNCSSAGEIPMALVKSSISNLQPQLAKICQTFQQLSVVPLEESDSKKILSSAEVLKIAPIPTGAFLWKKMIGFLQTA